MPGQLELLSSPPVDIRPEESLREPRLWIRRLKIWSEPGVELRDIELRPGLNIVWSPDPASVEGGEDAPGGLGHGSGKTLLCRLVRYCLGEERFASLGQREVISRAFKEGMVGAEVMLDGTPWAILRPLGIRRRHVAIPHGDLDAIATGEGENTGMAPFMHEVVSKIITRKVAELLPDSETSSVWLTALAWLSRDQECRLSHVLNWRAAVTDSDSPVRNMDGTDRLDALRALLGAIASQEQQLRVVAAGLEKKRKAAEKTADRCEWAARKLRLELARALELDESALSGESLDVDILRTSARENLAREAGVETTSKAENLARLRQQRDRARSRVEKLKTELHGIEAEIPLAQRLLSQTRGEMSNLSIEQGEAEQPPCPICAVPIDRVLAEGCKLSHKLIDLEAIRARWASLQQRQDEDTTQLAHLKAERTRLVRDLKAARPAYNQLQKQVEALEKIRDAREDAWLEARRLLKEVDRLQALLSDKEEATSGFETLGKQIEAERGKVAALRDAQAETLARLSHIYDAIIQELAGTGAHGSVVLSGRGLELKVEMGGERTSVAIESLKVLVFDLAAMCMTMEGTTHVPAFLLHDSPREADLGRTIYHRLFRFARSLEKIGGQPLFQYIVTTTTPPPKELSGEQWTRVELRGAPAEQRLLRRDL